MTGDVLPSAFRVRRVFVEGFHHSLVTRTGDFYDGTLIIGPSYLAFEASQRSPFQGLWPLIRLPGRVVHQGASVTVRSPRWARGHAYVELCGGANSEEAGPATVPLWRLPADVCACLDRSGFRLQYRRTWLPG